MFRLFLCIYTYTFMWHFIGLWVLYVLLFTCSADYDYEHVRNASIFLETHNVIYCDFLQYNNKVYKVLWRNGISIFFLYKNNNLYYSISNLLLKQGQPDRGLGSCAVKAMGPLPPTIDIPESANLQYLNSAVGYIHTEQIYCRHFCDNSIQIQSHKFLQKISHVNIYLQLFFSL